MVSKSSSCTIHLSSYIFFVPDILYCAKQYLISCPPLKTLNHQQQASRETPILKQSQQLQPPSFFHYSLLNPAYSILSLSASVPTSIQLSAQTRVMSPTAKAANNGHHCPKAHGREGNCRPWQGGGSKPQHCVSHQKVCPLHHEKHLKTEPCPTCEKVLKFTGSRPPPVEHQPRDYRPSNPPSNQRRPSQPRNRGARRSAGSRHGRGGNKGGNGQSKDGKKNK